MALKVTYINEQAPQPRITVNERLYRTRDGRLVLEGHPDAAFLFCAPGTEVDAAEFERLTLDVPEVLMEDAERQSFQAAAEDEGEAVPAAEPEGDEAKADEPQGDKRRKRRKTKPEDK